MSKEVKGVLAANLTPFKAGGLEVDYDWVPRHLDYLRGKGIDGVVCLGTNGEGPSLTMAERKRVIDTVLASRNGLIVVAGTGTPSLPDTIEISRYALERGVDALMVVPPFFYREAPTEGLIAYYRSLFKALPSNAVVYLYNIPRLSGIEISDELLDALSKEFPKQLAGLKDTSGSLEKTVHYIQRFPKLSVLSGSDSHIGPAAKAGAAGAVSGVANVAPHLAKAVRQAYDTGGDVDAAQARLSRVRDLFRAYPELAAYKHALTLLAGLPPAAVRPPNVELSADQKRKLEQELRTVLGQ